MSASSRPAAPTDPAQQLAALAGALQALRQGEGSVQALSAQAQASTALRAALPPRYATVLQDLLDRLESSALFSDESCSFSPTDLLASLQLWLDKAGAQLQAPIEAAIPSRTPAPPAPPAA